MMLSLVMLIQIVLETSAIGGVVNWKATLQPTVALSTTEAEFMAIIEAIKESIWLRELVGELHSCQGATIVHCDSQSGGDTSITREAPKEAKKHYNLRRNARIWCHPYEVNNMLI